MEWAAMAFMLGFGSSNGDIVAFARESSMSNRRLIVFTAFGPNQGRVLMDDLADISRQLIELRIEHRDLDVVIARLVADPSSDELQLRRLKKRKLRLKDMIAYLENKLIPDLDA
jgi:hypothetical protein